MRQNVSPSFSCLCAVQHYLQFSLTLEICYLVTECVCRQRQQRPLRKTEECMSKILNVLN